MTTTLPPRLDTRPSLDAVPLADADSLRWDGFAAAAEHSTFCHHSGWREVMSEVLGHETRNLVAVDGEGEWRGILPLVRVRSRVLGDYLVSMPFLNYGGPLGTPAAQELLAGAAVAEARRLGTDLLQLRARHTVASELPPTPRKVTVLLSLPATPAELWTDTLRAKLRSQIRRPQKSGMEARFGPDQAGAFYEVFARNMRDLGTPVLPRAFFEGLAPRFGDRVEFGAVYHRGLPVAAGCGFAWGDEFEMTWASSLREHNHEAPNMLLYYSFMERMVERGIRRFNFGRCTPGGGTHRFKRQWGGVDVPLPWLEWSPRPTAGTPSPERPVFRLATRAWSRLPLPVTRWIGPIVARSLP